MSKWLAIALLAALLAAVGCGQSKDKGINQGKDMPKPAEKP